MDKGKYLLKIKDRYGSKPSHHGDCNIYRVDLPHCSCGLIHDLIWLGHPEKIYPKFAEDLSISEWCDRDFKRPNEETIKKAEELVRQVFGDPKSLPKGLQDSLYEEEKLIKEIFGE